MKARTLTIILLSVITLNTFAQQVGPWNLDSLYKVPEWEVTNLAPSAGVTSILYNSVEYLENLVQVFAYYKAPSGTPPVDGWPAVVYAHGGGGTAIASWVTYWNSHGYACITMDLEGHIPTKVDGVYLPTPNPGPSRSGVFNGYEKPIDEQWYYHAIAQVIIAHTLIASFPEVDSTKIGVTGTSWGGTITSTVMGVDSRWAWAIPVYGTGYLSGSDGNQGRQLAKDDDKIAFVDTYYDGSLYFENVTFPTMWVTGTNDFHFPLTISQKSSQSVNGPATLLWALRFGHSNTAAQRLDQMYLFANQVVKGEAALINFEKPLQYGNKVYAKYTTDLSVSSAQLLYTYDKNAIWPDKYWHYKSATVTSDSIIATIPVGACVVFLNSTDSRGATVNTEYIEIPINTESFQGDTFQLVPRSNNKLCAGVDNFESVYVTDRLFTNDLSWKEMDQGNGSFSYQLVNTNYCMHGGVESADGQDVYLWNCDSEDQDQLWKKVEADSGYYRLLKGSSPSFALTIGSDNNLQLKASDENSLQQYWKNETFSQVSFKIIDSTNLQNLADVTLVVDGQTLNTDSNGEAATHLGNGQYSISFSKKGYTSKSFSLDLKKDTALAVTMERENYTLELNVSGFETDELLPGVSININDSVYVTDDLGSVSTILEFDEYDYMLSKDGYVTLDGTVFLETDTVISLQMELKTYRLAIVVKDAETESRIPASIITLNDSSYKASAFGSVLFVLLPDIYNYTISKDGYNDTTGSLLLEKDSTVTIFLSLVTSGINRNEYGVKIYPNPSTDILYIEGLVKGLDVNYQIVNTVGAVVKEGVVTEQLNITELNEGLYIINLQRNDMKIHRHILIKK